ncbi:hypothetical protein D9758_006357 [Tetrapyrgos nigripes]|uniref:Ecp2 effector protein domain-containing protein n=1 Tax=Tetrapyrgos nigripes TaxID=182062 RepID=A0A8H5DA81_9AGAR|nr:hypothetical protein D9758_006357 [Tetrapyrgos nigripes]
MKFTLLTLSLAMVSSTLAAPAPVEEPVQLSARAPNPGECVSIFKFDRGTYHNVFDQACVNLVESCRFSVAKLNSSDIWTFKPCVAAATCQGTNLLVDMVQCTSGGENVPEASQTNSLNYNIYAGIVGDCAWQEGGCPITQQNYIDFIFSTLGEIDTNAWPDVNNVINNWWTSIKDWTATGETVPYLNFNDWLRFSSS